MQPLLQREKTEFLINLMYDFANRAAGIEKHESDMIELLGELLEFSGEETPSQRQHLLLDKYRKNTSTIYQGKSTYVPINRPGTHKLLYFLVYFSRHPKGIIVFKEVAERMMFAQRTTYEETVIRKQLNSALCLDLFSDHDVDKENVIVEDNRYSAKKYLLTQLTKTPLLIDNECWARFLEESNLYPTDFQLAMKELIAEKIVENIDADVSRRKTQYIKPAWRKNSERWQLKEL